MSDLSSLSSIPKLVVDNEVNANLKFNAVKGALASKFEIVTGL